MEKGWHWMMDDDIRHKASRIGDGSVLPEIQGQILWNMIGSCLFGFDDVFCVGRL